MFKILSSASGGRLFDLNSNDGHSKACFIEIAFCSKKSGEFYLNKYFMISSSKGNFYLFKKYGNIENISQEILKSHRI